MKIPPFFPPKKIGLLRVNKRSTFDGNRYLIFLEKNLLKTNIDKQNSRVVFERNGRQFSYFFSERFKGQQLADCPHFYWNWPFDWRLVDRRVST